MKTRTLYLIETAVAYISGCLLSGVMGYSYCEYGAEDRRNEILKQNTEIMNSISGVAMTQSAVTDMLMRISHYTEEHEEGGNYMCPECSGREFIFDEIEDGDNIFIEPTHKNIMRDLREIENGIDSFVFGHLAQIKKLEYLIDQEKKRSGENIFSETLNCPHFHHQL